MDEKKFWNHENCLWIIYVNKLKIWSWLLSGQQIISSSIKFALVQSNQEPFELILFKHCKLFEFHFWLELIVHFLHEAEEAQRVRAVWGEFIINYALVHLMFACLGCAGFILGRFAQAQQKRQAPVDYRASL